MFFRVEGCLSTIRKTVMSSSQGSKGQAVQNFLNTEDKGQTFLRNFLD